MISNTQMKALLAWLKDGSDRVKFVVTSVPLLPDVSSDSTDKWTAFPAERTAILDHIQANKIRKVVFVSGDVHCSFACELRSRDDPTFLVHSVVSSSFFWPYPHTEQSDFRFGQPLIGTGASQYVAKRLTPLHATDNFARIDAAPSELTVTFYERKGDRLGKPAKLVF